MGFPLEPAYIKFLRQHNGTSFFQGYLQLLPLEQIAFVQSEHPAMIVIGEGKYDTWAVVVEGLPAELYSPEFRDLPLEEKVKRRRIQARDIDPEQLRYIYGTFGMVSTSHPCTTDFHHGCFLHCMYWIKNVRIFPPNYPLDWNKMEIVPLSYLCC